MEVTSKRGRCHEYPLQAAQLGESREIITLDAPEQNQRDMTRGGIEQAKPDMARQPRPLCGRRQAAS